MCLAIPARLVEKRDHDQAVVDLGGIRKLISIALVPEAQVGDHVVVHVGHAIGLIDPEEAARTLALFAEMQSSLDHGLGSGPSSGPLQAGSAPLGGRETHEMGGVGV